MYPSTEVQKWKSVVQEGVKIKDKMLGIIVIWQHLKLLGIPEVLWGQEIALERERTRPDLWTPL